MRDTTAGELILLHNPIRSEGYKVEIIRKSNDAIVDITDLVMSGSVTLSSDNRVSTCSINIEDKYPVCNTDGVSPYLTGSSYNTPDQLLWPGNEIKVYVAVNTLGSTANTFKMLFHGILGDAIVPGSSSSGKKTVSLTIRDQAKTLQDAFIKGEFVYGEAAGSPVVAVIQGILDDNVTETLHVKPTLDGNYDIDGCPFVVTPIKVGNCSVWDAINKVIGTTASDDIGYELRYKFLPKNDTSTTDNEGNTITISADGFYLTLLEIDQTQTVSDDNIVAGTDSISQYKINVYDDTIRNDIYGVFYARTTKERTEINVQDATSIAAYGKRTMVIGQKDYPWIDTTAEMEALMSVALNALKDVPATDAFSTQLLYHVEPNDLLGTTLARLTTGSAQVGITKITHNFATGGGAGRKKKSSTTFVGRRDAVVGGTINPGGGDDPGTTVAPTVSPTGYSSSFIQDVDGSYTRTTLNVTAFSDVLVEYYDWKYSIESSGEWVPATTSEPSYIVSNQPPSTNITWACRVKLVSEDGSDSNFTAWCADQTAVTASDGIAPAAPTLVANVGNQQCVLTLTKPATDSDGSANTDFDYFKVYYDTNATVTTADSFITTKSTQYPFPASVRTYFKAAAVDIWGNEGVLSSIDDAIPTSTSADALQALADAAQAQSTADGKIVGFYQNAQPGSGMAYGDIWIDTNGHTPNTTADIYRYQDATGGYTSGAMTWVNEPTSAIGLVFLNAASAQATADGKVTTFYQDAEPSGVGESEGDFWVDTNDGNKVYVYSGAAWVATSSADALQALADAAQAQSTADGKIVGFYQDAEPAAGMAYGDIWIDTDGHTPNTTADIYRYQDATGGYTSGAMTWVNEPTSAIGLVFLNAVAAQATADGKVTTFYQDGIPTSEGIGDLWVDTNDSNKIYRAASAGATTIAAGQWVLVRQEDSPGDYTETVIDGGVVTTGRIEVKDKNAVTNAGITGSTTETASSSIRIWAGNTYGNRTIAPFRVTQAGILYATGATISGVLTADTGYIGGTSGWVIAAGKMTASGIGLATTTGDATYAFWAGSNTPASAEFRVTHAGKLYATGAVISGTITATSGAFSGTITCTGTISGGTITGAVLQTAVSGGARAVMAPSGDQTHGFLIYDANDNLSVELYDSSGGFLKLRDGAGGNEIYLSAGTTPPELHFYATGKFSTVGAMTIDSSGSAISMTASSSITVAAGSSIKLDAVTTLELEANGTMTLDANGAFTLLGSSSVTMTSTSMTLNSSGAIKIDSSASTVELEASTSITIDAGRDIFMHAGNTAYHIFLSNLPTSDPEEVGALYAPGSYVRISEG